VTKPTGNSVGRPRLGEAVSRNRAVMYPDELWEACRAAALEDGVKIAEWLRDAAERKLTSSGASSKTDSTR
jgi:hypothetical protein